MGGEKLLLATMRDVDQRNKAEQRLEDSEKRYRELFESSRAGIMYTNLQGKISDCNRAFAEMPGYSAEELMDMHYPATTPERWYGLSCDVFDLVMEHCCTDLLETEYLRRGGKPVPVSLMARRVDDQHGFPAGIWSIVGNIRKQKEPEETIKRNAEELKNWLRLRPMNPYIPPRFSAATRIS